MSEKSSEIYTVNQDNSKKYTWKGGCFGWHYLHNTRLSIIREEMAPQTSEVAHFHNFAQQFFYILKGRASFSLEDRIHELKEGEGIHIPPKQMHMIKNHTNSQLEFLVISEPLAHGDRFDLPYSTNNINKS